jgi:hypothetical protein
MGTLLGFKVYSGGHGIFLLYYRRDAGWREISINRWFPKDAKKIWLVRNLPDVHIQVKDRAHGANGFTEWLGAYHRKTLRLSQRPSYYPEPTLIGWHVREVFQRRRGMEKAFLYGMCDFGVLHKRYGVIRMDFAFIVSKIRPMEVENG